MKTTRIHGDRVTRGRSVFYDNGTGSVTAKVVKISPDGELVTIVFQTSSGIRGKAVLHHDDPSLTPQRLATG